MDTIITIPTQSISDRGKIAIFDLAARQNSTPSEVLTNLVETAAARGVTFLPPVHTETTPRPEEQTKQPA